VIRGLFIGIDRYSAPVSRLGCAVADSQALGSLFADTLDGEIVVLLDAEATLPGIIREIEGLKAAAADDLVIVSFSGHGTDDHRLVPVDVDVDDLAGSCMSLGDLAEILDAIPSRHLLVFLDCCFSGGFGGARVFAPTSTRSMIEDRSSLVALARGSGRVVLTASGAGEPALETAAAGHGIFSYHLIAGLQAPGGIGAAGRISLLKLIDYVTRNVVEEAARLRTVQTPTMYGTIEGAPTLPVLVPGERFAAAFPERVRSPVTSEWSSLIGLGFSESVLAKWAAVMPRLNALQQQAINAYGVLDGKSLLVVAPTGSGKTFVGELATFKAVANGSRAVMLLPLKALVNDKFEAFTTLYGEEAVVVRATGEHSDQVGAIISGQYDLALLTYEKFMNLALAFPHVMRGISVVVVDEAQVIGDPNRGPSLEFLLALLRSGFARGHAVQIVALSAVIGDTNGLEVWLGGKLLRTTERPIPLRESVIDAYGSLRTLEPDGSESKVDNHIRPEMVGGSQTSKPWIIPLVRRLVGEGKKVIVFRATKGDTVGAASYLAGALRLPSADETLAALPDGDRSVASEQLGECVRHGVGFHNSDLDRDERSAIEAGFRDPSSPLRVLVATTTLAMGVNTPAEAVVIAGLSHPGGSPYSVSEYKNMAGRAGRLGHSDTGEAFIIATGDIGPGDAWHRYVNGVPEAVVSHFLQPTTDPQTLTLRALVALGSNVEESDLIALLENSFAVWRRIQDGAHGWNIDALRQSLAALIHAGLLDREPDGRLTVTQLGRYAGESGLEVRSVTNVASLMRYAPAQLSVADAVTTAQVTLEMDQQYIPANRKSHQEKGRWPSRLRELGASGQLINGLHVGGGDAFMRVKRAVATLLFLSAAPMAEIERELLQHYRDNSASGPIRAVSTRTRDVIDAVCRIAEFSGCAVKAVVA
jgi:helicase